MRYENVKSIPTGRRRERRLERAIEARRRLASADVPRPAGRAWINGQEVGGADGRFAHLSASYD